MANMIDNQIEVRGSEAAVYEFLRKTLDCGEPNLLGACRDRGVAAPESQSMDVDNDPGEVDQD